MPHVEIRFHRAEGYRCPHRTTTGVASPHGSHENSNVKNRRTQAWCMPSARIPKTVCVASTNPTHDQMAAIHNHRGGSDRGQINSITRSYCTALPKSSIMQPIALRMQRTVWLFRTSRSDTPTHDHSSENRSAQPDGSVDRGRVLPVSKPGKLGAGVHQRCATQIPRPLSRVDLPDHRLRHELQPRHANGGSSHVR